MICTNWFCINSTPNVFLFPFKYSAYVRFDYYHSLWGKTWTTQGTSRICPFICKRNIFMHHITASSSSRKPQDVILDVYFVLRVHLLQCAPYIRTKKYPLPPWYGIYHYYHYYHKLWGKTWTSQGPSSPSHVCPFICKRKEKHS